VELGERAGVFVVADDEGQVGAEFAGLVAMEEVGEAVRVLRDEEGDVLELVGELDAPVHAELWAMGSKAARKAGSSKLGASVENSTRMKKRPASTSCAGRR